MTQNAALAIGDEIELEITNLAHGGVCVARYEGRVVFVADAIPGERVMARVTEARKKSFVRASVTQVLEASPDRRPHVWPEADVSRDPDDRVGGAEFGHISLKKQRELKAFVLRDSMSRMAKIDIDVAVEAAPGDRDNNGLGWRTRVRLNVDPETGIAGPFAARSRRVIKTKTLPLADPRIVAIAPLGEHMPDVDSVDLIAPSADDSRMLITYTGSRERAGEKDLIREFVGERGFMVRAGGFWQVHREAPEVLFTAIRDAVAALAEEGRVDANAANMDLYGGAGLFAAAMTEAMGANFKVTSVESDANATDDAAENLAELVGARAITERVDRYLGGLLREANAVSRERIRNATVVLDPPRSGAGGEVCRMLAELAPANLIYVACDPVALARDVATFSELGYELQSVRGFDLFPHTHHVEALAVLRRK
ncbi:MULTISPECIES: class I SAM-dependent RNA methyltransferase [unclassified Leucobacter]|uniref:class I SAM-dependent RNA methyltransferase n=1 Tax=unclassified Leucobacter TaxID=2621730 RepID=UPI00165E8164|nr:MULTISPECIES: TRAM domain-containing protein [unclassified Leucobacter]MBC9927454.1 class I SAM-dependent RNA methyltransferase [Leucobacter sp. cx-169]